MASVEAEVPMDVEVDMYFNMVQFIPISIFGIDLHRSTRGKKLAGIYRESGGERANVE